MPYTPKTLDPLRVPQRLWRDLTFAWPSFTDPVGFLGEGALAVIAAAPKQFTATNSNAPRGGAAFTAAVTLTCSATALGSNQFAWTTTASNTVGTGQGFQLAIQSGLVSWVESDSLSVISADVSVTTTAGSVLRLIYVHNPAGLCSLMVNGTVQSSLVSRGLTWTDQGTIGLGFKPYGTSQVWSGGIRDATLFRRALTFVEQRALDEAMT